MASCVSRSFLPYDAMPSGSPQLRKLGGGRGDAKVGGEVGKMGDWEHAHTEKADSLAVLLVHLGVFGGMQSGVALLHPQDL